MNDLDRVEQLARKARRQRRDGEHRKAANTYGELTSVEPEAFRWWVLRAVMLRAAKRFDEAARCLKQALYLVHRAGEVRREHVLRSLVEQG